MSDDEILDLTPQYYRLLPDDHWRPCRIKDCPAQATINIPVELPGVGINVAVCDAHEVDVARRGRWLVLHGGMKDRAEILKLLAEHDRMS